MAQQLQKKFLGDDQVDGDKIKLEQGQSIRAVDSSNAVVDLVKLGASDEVLVNGEEVALQSALAQEISDRQTADAATLASAEAYTNQKIADLVDAAPALLDTLNELAAALGDDPNFVTTVTNLVAGVQSELDDTQTGAGLETDGSYVAPVGSNYLGSAVSLKDADSKLDVQAKQIADDLAQEAIDRANADSALQSEIDAAEDDISHLVTLSGVAVDSDNLGSFSGTTIADNQTIKQALQALESAVESVSGGGSSTQLELDATQLGAGLEADGSYVAPVGSNYLGSATSLKDADSDLDAQLKIVADDLAQEITDRSNADSAIQSELDTTQSGAGLEASGAYVAPAVSNYLSAASSLKDADSKLDTQLKTVADGLAQEIIDRAADVAAEESARIDADDAIQSELDATQSGAGLGAGGSYTAPVGSNYLGSAVSLKDADSKLDAQIKIVADDLAQEAIDRASADAGLQSDIDALELLQDDYVALDGSRPMTGNLNMMPSLGVHHKVVGLGDPTDPRDAANKQYVDAVAEGLHVHAPARLLADFDLDGVYNNGVDGVGAFLNTSASPIAGIDGVSSFSVGDRIIVTFQNGSNLDPENGIYFIADAADIDGNGDIIKLTRALDFNTPSEMAGGDFIFVQEGSQYGDTGWVMTETVVTVGTTPVKFLQFSGAGTYSAGDALDLTGTEFSVRVDNSTIVVNASNNLEVAPAVMSDLAGKVNKSGDTMTGQLTIENADLVVDYSVPGVVTSKTSVWDGEILLEYTDIATSSGSQSSISTGGIILSQTDVGTSSNASVQITANTQILNAAIVDGVNGSSGNIEIGLGAIGLNITESDNSVYSADYATSSFAISRTDGTTAEVKSIIADVIDGTISVYSDTGTGPQPIAPTLDYHLAPKKYVDDEIAAHVNNASDAHDASAISVSPAVNGQSNVQSALENHESRIDVLESVVWFKEKFPISNGQTSITLSHTPEANSMSAFVDRLAIHQGPDDDYTILGTTMTFLNDLVSPGQSELGAGDTVYVKYQYKV